MAGALVTIGASFGASRPWADTIGEKVVMALTFVLLVPLSLLNALLPRHLAPGFPVPGVLATSVLWGLVAYAIARWRTRRQAEGGAFPRSRM